MLPYKDHSRDTTTRNVITKQQQVGVALFAIQPITLPFHLGPLLILALFLCQCGVSLGVAQVGDVFSAGDSGNRSRRPAGPGSWIKLGPQQVHGSNGPYVWAPKCDDPRDHWLYGVAIYGDPQSGIFEPASPSSIRDPRQQREFQLYVRQQQAVVGQLCHDRNGSSPPRNTPPQLRGGVTDDELPEGTFSANSPSPPLGRPFIFQQGGGYQKIVRRPAVLLDLKSSGEYASRGARCVVSPWDPQVRNTVLCYPAPGMPWPSASSSNPIRGALEGFDKFIESVPGLAQAIQTGAVLTNQQRAALERDIQEFASRPDAGVRIGLTIAADELLAEAATAEIIAQAGSGIAPALTRLFAQPTERAVQLDTALAAFEQGAAPQVIHEIMKRMNPDLIAKLKNQVRGANPRINKITYWLQTAVNQGQNPGRDLATWLKRTQYTDPSQYHAAEMVAKNMLDNLAVAQRAGVLTPGNMRILRTGGSVKLPGQLDAQGRQLYLAVDHYIPVAHAPELGTSLVNLGYQISPLNGYKSDMITASQMAYARELVEANLFSKQGFDQLWQTYRRYQQAGR